MRIVLTMVVIALGIAIASVGSVYAWQRHDTAQRGMVGPAPVAVSTSETLAPANLHVTTGEENTQSVPSDSPLPMPSEETPLIFIWQYPDYPNPDEGSKFPGGLVAALWPDGRMIRATAPDAIGDSYVEGFVDEVDRNSFLRFLDTSLARIDKHSEGIPLHVAFQSIKVCSNDLTLEFSRVLPDANSDLDEVEQHLLALSLQQSRPVGWQTIKELKRHE